MRERIRSRGWLVGAVCALAAAATIAVPSTALAARGPVTSPPLVPRSTYLALGDSVTFGYQEQQVLPTPNYHNQASLLGYPEHIARELPIKVVNAACPGETTASLINSKAPSNGCENAYRLAYPLHVHYTGSQLAFAVAYLRKHPGVRLVSLMIGANDAFRCQHTTADHCTSPTELSGLITEIKHNVAVILSAIRNKAHYRGQLAIVNYYSLSYASAGTVAQSQLLNSTVDAAAKPFRVEIADGLAAFHAQAVKFAGSTCLSGLLTQWLVGGQPTCGVHPSYAGQALLAEALLHAVRF